MRGLQTNKYTACEHATMTSCIKCGATLAEFDVGGDMICQNCESSGASHGGAGLGVPCQRCGMYLPSHELRMHNSRLYCAYCIMDVQDDERRSKAVAGKGASGEEINRRGGICDRCGKETDTLYSVQGRKLCSGCHTVGSGEGGASAPSVLGLIIEKVAVALGVRQKPKIIPVLPQGKISIKVWDDDKARQKKSQERFNLKERRMMEEEEGQLGVAEPLSEGHKKEKKPAPEARKKFFSHLGGEKKE